MLEENMSTLVAQAMQMVGNKVINEAVQITPIDTGELRSRSFTEGPLYDESSGMWQEVVGYEKMHSDFYPDMKEKKEMTNEEIREKLHGMFGGK